MFLIQVHNLLETQKEAFHLSIATEGKAKTFGT